MKKLFFLSAIIASLYSCKKDNNNNNNNNKDVDAIKLAVQKVTTPVAPNNPGNNPVWFAMAGNKIYYANPSNTGLQQFMLEYDMGTNAFSSKTISTDVCACGFTSKIVSDGVDLYYIANHADKYSVANNAWSPLNYPANAYDNNGETGVINYNKKIYFFGGGTASAKFKYYDIAGNNWYNVTDGPYTSKSAEMVVVNNKLYALGGYTNNKPSSNFSSYTETEGWKTLNDLPFKLNLDPTMVHLSAAFANRYIFVLDYGAGNNANSFIIHIYDTNTQKWAANPIPFTANLLYYNVNLFSYNDTLYVVGTTASSNDFSLYKITVN